MEGNDVLRRIAIGAIGMVRHRDGRWIDINDGVAHRACVIAMHADAEMLTAGPLVSVKSLLLTEIRCRAFAKPAVE